MATITVFQRHEKKFLLDEKLMKRILPEIEKHMEPDEHCIGGKTYAICNLYFDTDRNDVIRESLQKPFYKEKLRLRSYGIPQSDGTRVFLELKKKVDGIVTKRRARLSYGEARQFLKDRSLPLEDSYMTRQVLREIAYYMSHKDLHADTRITYDRMAFFDRQDDSFRLTFDQNLRYLKADQPGMPVNLKDSRKGSLILPAEARLMEVKVTNAYPMWFARLLSQDGISPVSFSKYGVSYKKELIKEGKLIGENITILSHI